MRDWSLASVLLYLVLALPTFAATKMAPDITVQSEEGSFRLSDFRGQVIYLDFWASWCVPCRKSFPWMQQLQQKYRQQGLKVIAINLDKERKLADIFLKKFDVNFTIGFDPLGDTARAYQLQGMPGSYLIGRDGQLYASHIGFREKETGKIEQAVKILLRQPTP